MMHLCVCVCVFPWRIRSVLPFINTPSYFGLVNSVYNHYKILILGRGNFEVQWFCRCHQNELLYYMVKDSFMSLQRAIETCERVHVCMLIKFSLNGRYIRQSNTKEASRNDMNFWNTLREICQEHMRKKQCNTISYLF